MELKTLLLINTIAVFVITVLRRIANDEDVDLIGAAAGALLFILILVLSFLFEDRSVSWALIFGFLACESKSNMRGE